MRSNSVIATESSSRFWRWARSMSARRYKSYAAAYDLYLRADMLLAQRQNREDDSVAITLFERIVALDPSFAAAQAGLARAYALRVDRKSVGQGESGELG